MKSLKDIWEEIKALWEYSAEGQFGDLPEEGMVYTRNDKSRTEYFYTLKEAFAHADKDTTVWQIVFIFEGNEKNSQVEQVRLVRDPEDGRWMYDYI